MSFAYISTIKLKAFVARGVTYKALIATSAAKWSVERKQGCHSQPRAVGNSSRYKKVVATFQVTDVLPATMAFAYISTIRMCAWHGSGHT